MNDHNQEFQMAVLNPKLKSDYVKACESRTFWKCAAIIGWVLLLAMMIHAYSTIAMMEGR